MEVTKFVWFQVLKLLTYFVPNELNKNDQETPVLAGRVVKRG